MIIINNMWRTAIKALEALPKNKVRVSTTEKQVK